MTERYVVKNHIGSKNLQDALNKNDDEMYPLFITRNHDVFTMVYEKRGYPERIRR